MKGPSQPNKLSKDGDVGDCADAVQCRSISLSNSVFHLEQVEWQTGEPSEPVGDVSVCCPVTSFYQNGI